MQDACSHNAHVGPFIRVTKRAAMHVHDLKSKIYDCPVALKNKNVIWLTHNAKSKFLS